MKLTQFTLGAGLMALFAGTASAQVQLNEVYVSHGGTDDMEFIELKGPAGMSLDGYIVCVLESQGNSWDESIPGPCIITGPHPETGFMDRAWDLSGLTIPASGYFVLGDSAVTPNDFPIGTSNAIENGSGTVLLVLTTDVPTIMAMLGTDVDPDGDLTTAMSDDPNTTVVDGLGMVDAIYCLGMPDLADEFYDGFLTLGPEGSGPGNTFLPPGFFRANDGAWCTTEFLLFDDGAVPHNKTPGAPNGDCATGMATIGTNYCMVNATSSGMPSLMSASGSASIAANDLVISCNNLPGTEPGVFFYGATQGQFPFGEGFRCVTGTIIRLWPPAASSGGVLTRVIDYGSVPTPILSGSTWNFQGWFRDPAGGPSGFNLSDGLEIVFVP